MARITVVETEEFDRMCRSLLTEAERAALVDLVAASPLIGTALGVNCANSGLRDRAAERAVATGSSTISRPTSMARFFCS